MKILDLETWFRWDAFCLLAFNFRVLFSPEIMIIFAFTSPSLNFRGINFRITFTFLVLGFLSFFCFSLSGYIGWYAVICPLYTYIFKPWYVLDSWVGIELGRRLRRVSGEGSWEGTWANLMTSQNPRGWGSQFSSSTPRGLWHILSRPCTCLGHGTQSLVNLCRP